MTTEYASNACLLNGLYQEGPAMDGVSTRISIENNAENNISPATKWDPRELLSTKIYHIDYNPVVENRPRFKHMEGHLEVPNEDEKIVEPLEKPWKRLYFRTKEGRFQIYATHFADEHPIHDVLLTGTTIVANRQDWTIQIKGGKENANLLIKVPSNVWDKWCLSLLSHAHSSLIDAYVCPVAPPVPHFTKRVLLLELDGCSVRGGILTNKPSLPQSFFPATACVLGGDSGKVLACGVDAYRPDIRQNVAGAQLLPPIQKNPAAGEYRYNRSVFEAIIGQVFTDIHGFGAERSYRFDFSKHKALLSIPQDVPSSIMGDLMRTLLEFFPAGASIVRQPSLVLYSYEVTTGVVVDIGEESLSIVPIIDEYIVEGAVLSLPFGAPQIREALRRYCLRDQLNNTVALPNDVEEQQILLRYLVEQSCYVAVDYEEEKAEGGSTKNGALENVVLLGEQTFRVDNVTRFHVTEGLFKPNLWGLDEREWPGIHHLVHKAIQAAPIDSRRTLYRNIFLAGGTSTLPGLAERLESELQKLVVVSSAASSIFVQVHGSPWRQHAAYLGAQALASGLQFEDACIKRGPALDQYLATNH